MKSVSRSGQIAELVRGTTTRGLRVAPWRSAQDVVQVIPVLGARIRGDDLCALLDALAAGGIRQAVTAALAPADVHPFLASGFRELERLHLLEIDLRRASTEPPAISGTLRRPHRADWNRMSAIDARAFDSFWHLDEVGIAEATHATPTSRLRVVETDRDVVAYAVSGRGGHMGYVQRLAVDPTAEGRGYGSALLLDGLGWMRARGATHALVNTQATNERAVALYLRHGFSFAAHPLLVLGVDLDAR